MNSIGSSFFGYFGRSGHFDVAAAGEYGRQLVAAAPRLAYLDGPESLLGECWADSFASAGDVSVAVRGSPLIRTGAKSGWAHASCAQQVAQAYIDRGDSILGELGGPFSIVILDRARERVVMALDCMGIERICYRVTAQTLVFGTSAESVARFPGPPVAIDHDAILEYLLLHMVPSPGTVFRGVRKIRPGHAVIFERGDAREIRYFDSRFDESSTQSVDELKCELFTSLRTAVRSCEPGATTGAFLSGGLDSSTIAGVLSEVVAPRAHTFTIGFHYPDYDERAYSRAANAHFGCQAHEYLVSGDDILEGFPRIAGAFDEPFGNSSALPVYYCARLAAQSGFDHLLAGDGGDELFAGNSRYAEQEVFERYGRVPRWLRRGMVEPALAAWPKAIDFWLTRKARGYVKQANVALPARLESWNFLLRQGLAEVLDEEFRSSVDERAPFRRMQELWDATPGESSLNHMLYYDWQHTLADNDLRKVETMSRLAGVRVSYPMLHPDVVALSMRIPTRIKMPGTHLRAFYKRAMRGYLPDAIIDKSKHGFGLPFGLWLKETPRLKQLIDANLADLRRRHVVRRQFLDKLLDLHGEEDARYYGVFIWVLAMLEQWFKEHDVAP